MVAARHAVVAVAAVLIVAIVAVIIDHDDLICFAHTELDFRRGIRQVRSLWRLPPLSGKIEKVDQRVP
jgi:hypothetical protein